MRIVTGLFFAACAGIAWGDTPIYKWVDPQGHVHYSTVPPSSTVQPINIVNKGTLPTPSTAPLPAAATNTQAADAILTTPTPKDSADCKAARDRLSSYLIADSLYRVDASGNKQPLSPADKQRTLEAARNLVKQACVPGAP
ncbi:MAG: DUF4124 domain-containing protein [Bacillota bacterium]